MAYTGMKIANPVSGETITFVTTAAESDGELLAFDLELTPDGKHHGLPVHPEQTEGFRVVARTRPSRTTAGVAGPRDDDALQARPQDDRRAGRRHRARPGGRSSRVRKRPSR